MFGKIGRLLLAQRAESLKPGYLTRAKVQLDLTVLDQASQLEGELLSLFTP